MNRIIINNETDLSDEDVIYEIKEIIEMGRKRDNGKKYIPFHVIIRNGEIYYITTSLTKKGDSFKIVKV